VDYAVRKNRMLIEDDSKIADSTICRLIVFGLPKFVERLIEMKKEGNSDELISELGKLMIPERKNFGNGNKKPFEQKRN
jgi:hypothetical protein